QVLPEEETLTGSKRRGAERSLQRDIEPDAVAEIDQLQFFGSLGNGAQVVTGPGIGVEYQLERKLVGGFHIQQEQLDAAAVVFVEAVQRVESSETELLRRGQGRVRIPEREFGPECVAAP